MKTSENKKPFDQNKYDYAYKKSHYDRINFLMPKGTKERIQTKAQEMDLSVSDFIRQAIEEKLQS